RFAVSLEARDIERVDGRRLRSTIDARQNVGNAQRRKGTPFRASHDGAFFKTHVATMRWFLCRIKKSEILAIAGAERPTPSPRLEKRHLKKRHDEEKVSFDKVEGRPHTPPRPVSCLLQSDRP